MPRGPHDSHGLSTTRCPTSIPRAFGPTGDHVGHHLVAHDLGEGTECGHGIVGVASPKSIRICLESDPQMPVSRGRCDHPILVRELRISHLPQRCRGAGQILGQRIGRIGNSNGSGGTPVDERPHGRRAMAGGPTDVRVQVGVLAVGRPMFIRAAVVLRSGRCPWRSSDARRHLRPEILGPLVEGSSFVGLVPDLGLTGPRLDQLTGLRCRAGRRPSTRSNRITRIYLQSTRFVNDPSRAPTLDTFTPTWTRTSVGPQPWLGVHEGARLRRATGAIRGSRYGQFADPEFGPHPDSAAQVADRNSRTRIG